MVGCGGGPYRSTTVAMAPLSFSSSSFAKTCVHKLSRVKGPAVSVRPCVRLTRRGMRSRRNQAKSQPAYLSNAGEVPAKLFRINQLVFDVRVVEPHELVHVGVSRAIVPAHRPHVCARQPPEHGRERSSKATRHVCAHHWTALVHGHT